jgi:hypothetical protein
VTRRVLVEQNVEEREARLRNARFAVYQGELTKPCRACVERDLLADDVCARLGVHADDRPIAEAHLEPLHDGPVQWQRLRGANDAVSAVPVRRCEDLLGRHVRHEWSSTDGVAAAPPLRLRQQPDHQVGARAVEPDGVEAELVEHACACLELGDVRPPGGGGILVEPDCGSHRAPEPLDIGTA